VYKGSEPCRGRTGTNQPQTCRLERDIVQVTD
jgi:hypothetical protein